MESFVAELEAERIEKLNTYLSKNGLNDYNLTEKEKHALEDYKNLEWQNFNLEKLFGKSTRGKRLRSADRVSGTLPFVTAGETNEGVSDFIGNEVTVFSENSITIDMFGSAKYRNYRYGADDHIAVIHTEKSPKFTSLFITSAIHKSSYNGQFNYGRNFYAKDADALNISIPVKGQKPDYEIMETIISAIHRLVTKDVILYIEKKHKI
ncbi:restriction endonuclease subunit S [Chryseobacterium chendengshani]|uniref:restriction endonuclease subunit S n=1 Tax=Chryseobacterium sp. LJ668 TaxID=2864040 RepID=UPI001C68C326|nr:restriction endonuclease subunit S [Chryseobacterium sp. LJ668]MBW8523606.1 restriction endonuclease subunit S [Chryseobacterium sp. LJ668]QYK15888.1 restriction endonuclease subunit S [Chryseobacterium sp. LJ668]